MMENFNLDHYKSAWQEEKSFQSLLLTEADIQGFMKRRSKNILQQFKRGFQLDIVLKVILVLVGGTLCLLYPAQSPAFSISLFLILLTLVGIGMQWNVYRQIPTQNPGRENLLNLLKTYVGFYKNKYMNTLFVSAITGPLMFINGALLYYYFKYGTLPMLTNIDFIVLGTFLVLSYALGLIVQLNHHRYRIKEYDRCIQELEENNMTRAGISRYESMRKKILISFGITLLVGLVVLIFLLIK